MQAQKTTRRTNFIDTLPVGLFTGMRAESLRRRFELPESALTDSEMVTIGRTFALNERQEMRKKKAESGKLVQGDMQLKSSELGGYSGREKEMLIRINMHISLANKYITERNGRINFLSQEEIRLVRLNSKNISDQFREKIHEIIRKRYEDALKEGIRAQECEKVLEFGKTDAYKVITSITEPIIERNRIFSSKIEHNRVFRSKIRV